MSCRNPDHDMGTWSSNIPIFEIQTEDTDNALLGPTDMEKLAF